MVKDLYQFQHEREREHALQSMRAYLRNKPEQVKLFEELIGPYLKDDVSVLDACWGIGDLLYFLSNPATSTRSQINSAKPVSIYPYANRHSRGCRHMRSRSKS